MLPDTIHADQARSGLRREGAFSGVWTANEKTAMALGALLAGLVLELMGFVESVPGRLVGQPASALLGIRLIMALVPPALLLLSLPILRRYDLTPERLASLDRDGQASPNAF
jgi:Na+/melibiose symporter-like transporter